jgi:hypothetical protein
MKKIIIALGILVSQLSAQSQQFVNGNFTPVDFLIPSSDTNYWAGYGPEMYELWMNENKWWGNVKIVNFGWSSDLTIYPVISVSENIWYDVLSLDLDSSLTIGQKYKISFKEKLNLDVPLTFETTYTSGEYGQEIHTFYPNGQYLSSWKENSFEFIAQDSAKYINVYINFSLGLEYSYSQRAIDNFVIEKIIEPNVNIQENTINYNLKYTAYSIEGKLLHNSILISELDPGFYILENNNQTFKLIK